MIQQKDIQQQLIDNKSDVYSLFDRCNVKKKKNNKTLQKLHRKLSLFTYKYFISCYF